VLSAIQIEDALSSDVGLWSKWTTTADNGDGSVRAELADGIMPDGRPCAGVIRGKSKAEAVGQWFTYVRGQYDARSQRQEAAAIERAETLRASGGGETAAPGELGDGKGPAQADPQAREASLEEVVESKIVAIGRRLPAVEEQIAAAASRLAGLNAERDSLLTERAKATKVLKLLKRGEAS
jgi:hypothetical protein